MLVNGWIKSIKKYNELTEAFLNINKIIKDKQRYAEIVRSLKKVFEEIGINNTNGEFQMSHVVSTIISSIMQCSIVEDFWVITWIDYSMTIVATLIIYIS